MEHHIFLSYSRKDTQTMVRLRDEFKASDLVVWTDEGIEPGTPSWRKSIETAIKHSGCVVVIFSPDSTQSYWVQAELDYAWTQRKPIFPVLAHGEDHKSIPMGFAGYQFTDIRDETHYTNRIQYLISTIRKTLNILPTENLPTINGRVVLNGSQSAEYLSKEFQQVIRPYQITRWVQQSLFETVNVSDNSNYLIYRDTLFIPPRKRRPKTSRKNIE